MKFKNNSSELEEMYGLLHEEHLIERRHIERKEPKYPKEGHQLKGTVNTAWGQKQPWQRWLGNCKSLILANTFLKPFNFSLILISIYLLLEYKNNFYFNPVLPSLLFLFVLSDFFITRRDNKKTTK